MPAKFSVLTVAALPIIPIALACSGDDGGGKISVRPDAAALIDAAPVVCTGSGTYADVPAGSNKQFAGSDGSDAMYQVFWGGFVNSAQKPDLVQVSLLTGRAPFDAGPVPVTVSLTGDQAKYDTCGACVFMFTDLYQTANGVQITDMYMPTAGTLMLTSTAGTFTGTITGLMLQHMVMSGDALVPANDGCTASVPMVTMNAMLQPQMMMATGKPDATGNLSLQFRLPHRTF